MAWNLLMKLNGWKTYVLSVASVVYGISGVVLGQFDANAGIAFIMAGLMGASFRHGLPKKY